MGFPKYREDDLDRRVENRAVVLDEFQPSFTQGDWPNSISCYQQGQEYIDAIDVDPPVLTAARRGFLGVFLSWKDDLGHVASEVLAYADRGWRPRFRKTAKMSKMASIQMGSIAAAVYYDECGYRAGVEIRHPGVVNTCGAVSLGEMLQKHGVELG
jgi:hypothetical protein